MIKNYFKIAWRNLIKNKAFSFLNISGLAIGMASAVLILLWVQNEISYDRFTRTKTESMKPGTGVRWMIKYNAGITHRKFSV